MVNLVLATIAEQLSNIQQHHLGSIQRLKRTDLTSVVASAETFHNLSVLGIGFWFFVFAFQMLTILCSPGRVRQMPWPHNVLAKPCGQRWTNFPRPACFAIGMPRVGNCQQGFSASAFSGFIFQTESFHAFFICHRCFCILTRFGGFRTM